ncbi:hypothetical protein SESBI_39311 [Sesbania bispinosa]|nr:hypothetical protein SESBI_39311 [Sesbania bispinosa]
METMRLIMLSQLHDQQVERINHELGLHRGSHTRLDLMEGVPRGVSSCVPLHGLNVHVLPRMGRLGEAGDWVECLHVVDHQLPMEQEVRLSGVSYDRDEAKEVNSFICPIEENNMCEVTNAQVDGNDFLCSIQKTCKISSQDGRIKKRRRSPNKQVQSFIKVNDFAAADLIQTFMALDYNLSKIVERVWDLGNGLGMANNVDSSNFIHSLVEMKIRDRVAMGREEVRDN